MAAHRGLLLGVNPLNNGSLTFNVMFKTPVDWLNKPIGLKFNDPLKVQSFLIDKFDNWDECFKKLLQATFSFWGLPTKKIVLDRPWKTERILPVTLIGDAAHLMQPFAGQGVNTGMLDAMVLTESLLNPSFYNIEDALQDYEKKMFIYAKAAQDASNANELEMHNANFEIQKLFLR
jgi:tetracycline resistance monooxygenase